VDLYTHSPIRLHDVVLNSLSTGTTLPYHSDHHKNLKSKTDDKTVRLGSFQGEIKALESHKAISLANDSIIRADVR
jgi:hypothetical protein